MTVYINPLDVSDFLRWGENMESGPREVSPWPTYFFNLARVVSTRSKDSSQQVGCVIVGAGNSVLSMGYNGFPRGVNDNKNERHLRPLKYKWVCHSEENAILNAAREGISLLDSDLYIDVIPCSACARMIIQAGIKNVYINGDGFKERVEVWKERWSEEFDISLEMMFEGGVSCNIVSVEGFSFPLHPGNWRDR